MRSLLTILIATWNRRKDLEKLLSVLAPQLANEPDVNVVISNNGSTDDTAQLLRSFENGQRVRIVHQPCNLGLDLHLAWLFGQATGQFLWMIGDDDMMEPDLLELVCAELRSHPELGWIHLPGTYQLPLGPVLTRCPLGRERERKARDLFAQYISWTGWITANVSRTELIQACIPSITLRNSWWMQELLMKGVADAPAVVLPFRKLVAGKDITWSVKRHDVVIRQIPQMILDCQFLTAKEQTACLRQRYAELPTELFELLKLSPWLFFQVVARCPERVADWRFLKHSAREPLRLLYRRWIKPPLHVGHGRE